MLALADDEEAFNKFMKGIEVSLGTLWQVARGFLAGRWQALSQKQRARLKGSQTNRMCALTSFRQVIGSLEDVHLNWIQRGLAWVRVVL